MITLNNERSLYTMMAHRVNRLTITWTVFAILFAFAAGAQAPDDRKEQPPDLSFLVEAGYSRSYSQTKRTDATHDNGFGYRATPFGGFAWAFGVELRKKTFVYNLRLKQVEIGEYLGFSGKTEKNLLDYDLFRTVSKTNHALALGFGQVLKHNNFIFKPMVGVEYYFRTELVNITEASVTLDKDSILINTASLSERNFTVLLNASMQAGYRFNASGKRPFTLTYGISFSYGLNNLYQTETRILNGKKAYTFSNQNKGTHLCHLLVFSVPLSTKNKVAAPAVKP